MELISREKSETSKWIVGRSPYFLSLDKDGTELWLSRRPCGVNRRIYKFPAGYTPTLQDIDEAIAADYMAPLSVVARAAAKAATVSQARDDAIRAAHAAGETIRAIATAAGLSHQRVHQILHRH